MEPRNLLAGNVTADASTGTLVIQGDNSANVITLTQPAAGQIRVTGSGTKVNGTNSAQTYNVTNGVYIDLSGGSDVLTIKNLTVNGADVSNNGGLAISMGTGNDVVVISNVSVPDGFCGIDTGDGSDAVSIDKGTFGGGLYIAAGSGNNAVTVSRSTMFEQLQILGGGGVDAVTLVNDTVIGPNLIPPTIAAADLPPSDTIDNIFSTLVNDFGGAPITPGVFIDTGSGVDAVVITGAQFDALTQINTEAGIDVVAISNSRFGDASLSPAPAVQPALDPPDLEVSGLCIETGLGNDAVSIVNTTVYGFLQIDTSGQICCPTETMVDNVSTQEVPSGVKDGVDAVALVKVNVRASAVMEVCSTNAEDVSTDEISNWCSSFVRDECGELLIYTGNQVDAVTLASVNTDCKACIVTTDEGDTSLDGTDAVAIANCNFNQNVVVSTWFTTNYGYGSTGLEITTGRGNDVVSIAKTKVNDKTTIDTGDGTDVVALAFLSTDHLCVRMGGGNYDVLTVSNCTAADEVFDGGDGSGDLLNWKHLNNHFGSAPLVNGFETVV